MDPRLQYSSKFKWNIGMELVEAADRMNSGHQPAKVLELYQEALTHLMQGRSETAGPPPNEKVKIITQYLEKAEALKSTLSQDQFSTCLELANKTITRALNYDKEHNYIDALTYYRRGVDLYHRALGVARSEQEKTNLKHNIGPYERRLAKLERLVEEGKRQAILATYDEEEGDKPACWDDRLTRATQLASRAVKLDRKRKYVQVGGYMLNTVAHLVANKLTQFRRMSCLPGTGPLHGGNLSFPCSTSAGTGNYYAKG